MHISLSLSNGNLQHHTESVKNGFGGGGVLVVKGYREAGVVGEMKGIPDEGDSSVRRARNTE